MIHYICDHCGVAFDAPATHTVTESLGEFARTYTEEACPICGCDSFSEADLCEKCGEPKLTGELLCKRCRDELKAKFTAFADHLTAEEEAQLDEWLDGDSVTNRKAWR